MKTIKTLALLASTMTYSAAGGTWGGQAGGISHLTIGGALEPPLIHYVKNPNLRSEGRDGQLIMSFGYYSGIHQTPLRLHVDGICRYADACPTGTYVWKTKTTCPGCTTDDDGYTHTGPESSATEDLLIDLSLDGDQILEPGNYHIYVSAGWVY